MKNNPNWIVNLTIQKLFSPVSELGKKIQFSYPQSSALVLGDYRGIMGVQEAINQLILDQFNYSIYIFDGVKTNGFAQSLLKTGYLLKEVTNRDISEGNSDYDILIDLFKKNERIVISVEGLPVRLRNQYWKLLNLNIRSFVLEKRAPSVPYIMVWVDRTLTLKEPEIFEEFRILGLWGEEYGLRFTLFYDQYASLSSPARTLFGAIALFPGIPNNEVREVLASLSVDIMIQNYLFKLYHKLGMHQMLVVSPSDMFTPFLTDFV